MGYVRAVLTYINPTFTKPASRISTLRLSTLRLLTLRLSTFRIPTFRIPKNYHVNIQDSNSALTMAYRVDTKSQIIQALEMPPSINIAV